MQSENSFAAHLLQIVKAVVLAVLFCLVAVLIFSLVLKFASLSDSVIKPVNQFIKVFAILFGCFFALRGEKGWLKGIAVGLLTVMLTYLVFAMVGGVFHVLADCRGARFRCGRRTSERHHCRQRPSRIRKGAWYQSFSIDLR